MRILWPRSPGLRAVLTSVVPYVVLHQLVFGSESLAWYGGMAAVAAVVYLLFAVTPSGRTKC